MKSRNEIWAGGLLWLTTMTTLGAAETPEDIWLWECHGLLLLGMIGMGMLAAFFAGLSLYLIKYRRVTQRSLAIQKLLPIRITVFDRNCDILYFHPEEGTGEHRLKQRYANLKEIPGLDVTQIANAIHDVFTTGRPLQLSYNFYDNKRTVTITRLDKKIYKKDAVVAVSSDSSKLQEARTRADDAARRMEQTLRAIGDAVIVTDTAGLVTMFNDAASLILELSVEQATGKRVENLYSKLQTKDGQPLPSPMIQVLQGEQEQVTQANILLTTKLGHERQITGNATAIRNSANEIIGAILVFRETE